MNGKEQLLGGFHWLFSRTHRDCDQSTSGLHLIIVACSNPVCCCFWTSFIMVLFHLQILFNGNLAKFLLLGKNALNVCHTLWSFFFWNVKIMISGACFLPSLSPLSLRVSPWIRVIRHEKSALFHSCFVFPRHTQKGVPLFAPASEGHHPCFCLKVGSSGGRSSLRSSHRCCGRKPFPLRSYLPLPNVGAESKSDLTFEKTKHKKETSLADCWKLGGKIWMLYVLFAISKKPQKKLFESHPLIFWNFFLRS